MTLRLYDYTGTPVTPTARLRRSHPRGASGCSAFIDFQSGSRPPTSNVIEYASPTPAGPLTLEFTYGSQTRRLVFGGDGTSTGCSGDADSFLCSNTTTHAASNADIYIGLTASGLKVSPNVMWLSGGSASHYITETISARGGCGRTTPTSSATEGAVTGRAPNTSGEESVLHHAGGRRADRRDADDKAGLAHDDAPGRWRLRLDRGLANPRLRARHLARRRVAEFRTEDFTLDAATASGWNGVSFTAGASGELKDSFVGGARYTSSLPVKGSATLRVNDADVTLTGTTIQGVSGGQKAASSSPDQQQRGDPAAVVHPGPRWGRGGRVQRRERARGGWSQITANRNGGVRALGTGAVLRLNDAEVTGNPGVGADALNAGVVKIQDNFQNTVSFNEGGLSAETTPASTPGSARGLMSPPRS